MDQNTQHENESIFFAPVKKDAAYYRREARARLAGKWKIGYIVSLLALILGAVRMGFSFNVDTEDIDLLSSVSPELILSFLPLVIVIGSLSAVAALAFDLFVSGPTVVGYHQFHLAVIDQNEQDVAVPTLFSFFKKNYLKAVLLRLLNLLVSLVAMLPLLAAFVFAFIHVIVAYIGAPLIGDLLLPLLNSAIAILLGAIGSLALSVPVLYAFSAAPFIMADYPEVSAVEAMRNSRHLMRGHKWKLFCLDLSFVGWILLGLLMLGIGIVFVLPYINTAHALFYDDISGRATAKETEFPSLDPNDYNPDTPSV